VPRIHSSSAPQLLITSPKSSICSPLALNRAHQAPLAWLKRSCIFFCITLTPADLSQSSEIAVTDREDGDIEGFSVSSSTARLADPFMFRDAVKTDAQLAELRRRKKGKRLEKYHRRQNNVFIYFQFGRLTYRILSSLSNLSSSQWRSILRMQK
jgi:hypothetical protein